MKKVLFVSSFEGVGGTEISLLNLLKELNQNTVSVDLLLIGKMGPLVEKIPKWVNVIGIEAQTAKGYIFSELRSGRISRAVHGVGKYIKLKHNWMKTHTDTMQQYKDSLYLYPKIEQMYDVAITWYVPNSIHTVFTLYNVSAIRKIMWIHMDVSNDFMPGDAEATLVKYDRIYCVSKACKNAFDKKYHNCIEKTEVFYNILNVSAIKEAGSIPVEKKLEDKFKIVTCGRLAPEKQPLLAIEIVEALLRAGRRDFVWYFIGDGILLPELQSLIVNRGLEDYFVILGCLDNPNAYVSKCDLYVQLSIHESYCLTLAEAQILGVPAVSTNFPSAYEIVNDGKTGFIVNNSWMEIANILKRVMDNTELLRNMRERLNDVLFSSSGNVNVLLDYIERK